MATLAPVFLWFSAQCSTAWARCGSRGACLCSGAAPTESVSLSLVSVEEAKREIAVIGAPLDLGAGRRGVDMGPSAIRYAGLEQQLAEKLGVRVSDAGNIISPVVEATDMGDEHARDRAQIPDPCDRLPRR